TTNGGRSWTPLMDSAQTLAIGAVTIDPVTPTTVFVGTGEGNQSGDSFFGIGLYRITNADTTPVVAGPFETRVAASGTGAGNGHAFQNTAINKIAVDPTNDNKLFAGNTIGFVGNPSNLPPRNTGVGLYFSNNALDITPTFSRVSSIPGCGNG